MTHGFSPSGIGGEVWLTGTEGAPGGSGDAVRGPIDASRTPRFAGPPTFAMLPRRDEVTRCDVAVVGVPFDSGTSYRPGARFGPAAVRQGSRLLRPWHPGLDVAPFGAQQVADAGDIACNPFDIKEAVDQIEAAAAGLLRPWHPGRYDVPLSNGTPTTATSQRSTSSRRGSSAKVGGPAKRGVLLASIGPRSAPGWLPSVPVNLHSRHWTRIVHYAPSRGTRIAPSGPEYQTIPLDGNSASHRSRP